jgi:addiction module HigA family antidote
MLPKKRAPTHPGEMLQEEFLKPMEITQTAFAKHLGWSHAKINEIITGKRGVTPEAALSFADALGTTADLWLNLQKNYDLWVAQQIHKKKRRLPKAS